MKKLIETSEKIAAEETARSQIHKETHEKKKLTIFIIYLYPINSYNCQIFKEKKKIAERNKQRKYITHDTRVISSVLKCVKIANLRL